MRVRFFGTRGSIATPSRHTLRYGGNTSCVEVRSNAGTLVILDMGTGAAVLGRELLKDAPPHGHVLISHTHWDHIQGIPFFAPFKIPGSVWDIYAPRGFDRTLRETLAGQMEYTYFPVALEQLGATIRFHELVEGRFRVGDIEVTSRYLNHPALTLGYRLEADGVGIVYACDHEPHSRALATGDGDIAGEDRRHAEFLAGADLVLHDAQYLAGEYRQKVGWGHSTVEYALAVARFAGAKRLALTHHDPLREDRAIDELVAALRSESRRTAGPKVFAAAEGQELELSATRSVAVARPDFPAQAQLGSALVGRSALLAMETPSKISGLSDALRADDVHIIVSDVANAPAAAQRERPMLVLLEDTGDARAAAASRAIRHLAGEPDELPIVLVTPSEPRGDGMENGFSDFLVEPYSPVYARTRIRAWLMRAACHWVRAPTPNDEERRLAATRALGLIETPPEERFDRITRLAAALFDVPIALIALMERDREWFKSRCGLDLCEVPRDESFCGHSVYLRQPLVVADARLDERFADNPYVTGPPGVRFYAGHPLILPDGSCVGTICVLDTRPRHIDNHGLERLRDMADLATRELEFPK